MFSSLSKGSLAKAVLSKDQPIYVQFYITARCNLTANNVISFTQILTCVSAHCQKSR